VIVRPVREDEYDAVGELTVAAYRAIPGAPSVATDGYASQLRDVSARVTAGCEVMVAVAPDGSLAGGVTYGGDRQNQFAEFEDPEAAGFRMLAVSPSHQRSGAGTALTAWCIDRARSTARNRIIISSTQWMTTAHRIYERKGFVRMPELDWSPVPGFVLMTFVLELS
jgi:GNAT superfamily N-acetyltransferase